MADVVGSFSQGVLEENPSSEEELVLSMKSSFGCIFIKNTSFKTQKLDTDVNEN